MTSEIENILEILNRPFRSVIDAIYIGNFKAFRELQRIPLKPITLVFGPNSSGKSSIIQSIAMAHESQLGSLKRYSSQVDVHRTEIGGESIDLGGFDQYVYGGNKGARISWGVDISVERCPRIFGERFEKIITNSDTEIKRVSVIISIGYLSSENGEPIDRTKPEVVSIQINADDEKIIEFGSEYDYAYGINNLNLKYLASDHFIFQPAFKRMAELAIGSQESQKEDETRIFRFVNSLASSVFVIVTRLFPDDIGLAGQYDDEELDDEVLSTLADEEADSNGAARKYLSVALKYLPVILNNLILDPFKILESELKSFEYLGPLRTILPRHSASSNRVNEYVDAGGAHAWNTITHSQEIRDKINSWLGSEQLKTPYEVITMTYTSALNSFSEALLFDKRSQAILTHRDVGIGISQVLPVLVTAFGSSGKLIAIEQPEIHLHPALQAELGDVFIKSALEEKRKNTLILETHSEHLMLRIMRRMRETAEGTLPDGIPPVRPEDVMVLYVEPDGQHSIVREMPLNERGELVKAWPGGFFEEGLRELF